MQYLSVFFLHFLRGLALMCNNSCAEYIILFPQPSILSLQFPCNALNHMLITHDHEMMVSLQGR